jgi:hypothetical protein
LDKFRLSPVDEKRHITDLLWAAHNAIEAERELIQKLQVV